MAERKWTRQQLKAIEAEGTLTVLSAAAGSGKTTVLVEKALRILLDEENKTPADRLLIVTFSNASAKEFKNRIEKGINNAIRNNPENAYIKSQKIALQNADISTIHSFCIKLARENFEALDIAPDFTICDDARSMLIHRRAIDEAMEYGYTLPDFADFVTLFGKSSQDNQVREFLQYMYNYFSALPFPQQRAMELAKNSEAEHFEDTAVYQYLWQDLGKQIDYLEYLYNRQKTLVVNGDVDAYAEGVLANGNIIAGVCEAYENNNVFLVKSYASQKLGPIGRIARGEATNYSDAVKSVNDKIKEVLANIAADTEYLDGERWKEDMAQTGRYIKALTDVFIFYSQRLMEIKKQEKIFEFSDFEHFAVQLLTDEKGERTPLAKALSQKYIKIMEDEFQDTSYVQDMIFKTIAKDEESNLFVVGDVKQSIYGFRKASPEILLKKRALGIEDPRKATTIVLPNNFRSEVNVIRGVNYLFEQIMTKDLGGVDYKYGEQLLPAPGRTDSGAAGTELLFCLGREGEAEMVARQIKKLVEENYHIEENGTKRAVKYDDFCILLRNKKRFEEFENALKAHGIKSWMRSDQLLLEKEEVQSVISLLKVVNNPMAEVYLTATMFGDIFDFTLDEVLALKLKDRKENLYRLLAQSDGEKAKAFLGMLKEFSFAAKIYSADKLVDYIINATGYYTRLSFDAKGAEKRENIRRFILFAKEYVSGYKSGLDAFLRYIDLCIESGKGQGEAATQPAGTVAIMTMHTSKGLEFPVCFISGLGTAFNKMDRANRLMIDPVLGMATYANEKFGYNRSTAGIHAIKKKILAANADDEMRLLYVALTRAKNKNFITAQFTNMFTPKTFSKVWEKTSFAPHSYALVNATTPIEWILTGFVNHPRLYGRYYEGNKESEQKVTFERMGVDKRDIKISKDFDFDKLIAARVFDNTTWQEITDSKDEQNNPQPETETAETEQQENVQPKENDAQTPVEKIAFSADKAMENMQYVYPHMPATKLPIKVSVGEIAKAPPPVVLKKPDFAVNRGATAAQKGTQMHLFAQHSDILLARTNLDNEIERLSQAGIVDAKLLNKRQIETFISSDVAAVMLSAEKIYKEKEFLVPYAADKALQDESYNGREILVQGVIDCLVINGDKAVVIDYKTDRVEDMHTLYERYAKQLELYRYAAMYLYDVSDVQCIIYSFHLGESISF